MPRKLHREAKPDCLAGSRATTSNRCGSLRAFPIPEEAMYYLGIDVHKRDSYIAVLDDDGEVVEEVRVQ